MSTSTISRRRPFDSPCHLQYPRASCRLDPAKPARTTVRIAECPENRGKIYYSCIEHGCFVGWCIPVPINSTLAYEESNFTGGKSNISPNLLSYKAKKCTRFNCHGVSDIRISSSVNNPGKLYYTCVSCSKFIDWCTPYTDSGIANALGQYSERPYTISEHDAGESATSPVLEEAVVFPARASGHDHGILIVFGLMANVIVFCFLIVLIIVKYGSIQIVVGLALF